MSEYAIKVSNVSLSYYTHKGISIKNLFHKNIGQDKFQALRGIDFELKKGRILGIVGRNGSGKSTLLRAIGGIFSVDQGNIDLFGNKVSLLSIGVGFNYLLTGRENVILSGMLTGFSKEEVISRMDQIIAFAEIGDFIDRPVSTYSSGMYSKLAFSLATELNTDILLVDEVLSVGDEKFAAKSYYRMKQLIQDKNHTVVIVSHNLAILEELCDEVLWIHDGETKALGLSSEVLAQYKKYMRGGTP
ncbi:ABC transporter ATP-binding protein [Acetatifactor aquisgranensis]|uniref:ABC transporter ATP-binding protein n=1 Tax=Acetatifactor aquisgranensis TaxID=2941233 RepID=UPI00203E95E8|nr:ABC transporter ATP-binding protein [Acetatifactor aquisgranensis]